MATKSNKLIRRIRRELIANPKKAAVLALLLAVAVWFWMPLIETMLGRKPIEEATATVPGSAAANSLANAANPTASGEAVKSTSVPWKQLVDWIHDDPMMQPKLPLTGARNPFAPSESHRLAREQVERSVQPPPPDVTPEQMGLALRSTVIGLRNKTAMINERAYHEGQIVKASKGNDRFKLVQIATNYVVLESNGKQYQLKLPTAEVAGVEE